MSIGKRSSCAVWDCMFFHGDRWHGVLLETKCVRVAKGNGKDQQGRHVLHLNKFYGDGEMVSIGSMQREDTILSPLGCLGTGPRGEETCLQQQDGTGEKNEVGRCKVRVR